jgi:hypothetical protein
MPRVTAVDDRFGTYSHVRRRRLSRRSTVGRNDRKDKDEESQGDGFVGWMPRAPEPGKHATDEEEDQPQDKDQIEDGE